MIKPYSFCFLEASMSFLEDNYGTLNIFFQNLRGLSNLPVIQILKPVFVAINYVSNIKTKW